VDEVMDKVNEAKFACQILKMKLEISSFKVNNHNQSVISCCVFIG